MNILGEAISSLYQLVGSSGTGGLEFERLASQIIEEKAQEELARQNAAEQLNADVGDDTPRKKAKIVEQRIKVFDALYIRSLYITLLCADMR